MITGAAIVAGVVGAPVRHSLSPLIHNAWLEAAGVDGAYVPFSIAPDGFDRFIKGLRGGAVRGLNVTVPFKERALKLADRADRPAKAIGAANLLLFGADGTIEARNTDGDGLLEALNEQAPDAIAQPTLILGAGGAARAAAHTMSGFTGEWGREGLWIANRTRRRAEALARNTKATAVAWERVSEHLSRSSLVINATTRGLGNVDPLQLDWPPAQPGDAAMDMVYSPLRTAFLAGAAAAGWTTVDGLAMLIGQASPSFEAFYGRPPPAETDVRALCLAELARRSAA